MQKIRWCDRWTGEKKNTDLFCLQLWYTWAWSSGNITVTTGCGQRDPWWLCGQEEGWEGGGKRDTEPEWGRASNDSMRNPCTGDKTEITCLGTSWLSAITQILSIYSFLSLYLKKMKDIICILPVQINNLNISVTLKMMTSLAATEWGWRDNREHSHHALGYI